jgi:aminopeptidase N
VVHNGTFLNSQDFPTVGYNKKYELDNPEDRALYDLEPRTNKANRDDVHELLNARSGSDSDGINFDVTVGTSMDQTAIAPGDLINAWEEEGRKYFNYKMNVPMINFYSIVSARYEVKEEVWQPTSDSLMNPVDLAVYYHKGHEYNVDRMLNSMHKSLDYFSEQFSPYQYNQLRIMEFPRYESFAQSFPATIPFSEAIGFVLDINDEIDVDMAFYITAHEVAHQWWGMQVEAANVQGQRMILETLAQYAALMVLKENYPEEKVQQFLTLQLDKYNTDRVRATTPEPPLALVESQDYIYYNKGASAMYALQKAIGEENVNLALRRFISDWTTANGQLKKETKRYATTKDLLDYFREVTPSSMQHIISDLFETVEDQ